MSSLERMLDGVARSRPALGPGQGSGLVAQPSPEGVPSDKAASSENGTKAEQDARRAGVALDSDQFINQGARAAARTQPREKPGTFDSRAAFQDPAPAVLAGFDAKALHWKPSDENLKLEPKVWENLERDPLAAYSLDLKLGDDTMCRERPAEAAKPKSVMETLSDRARAQMQQLLNIARRSSAGRRPDGRCYNHVWRFITSAGYGRMPYREVPAHSHGRYAKQFAYYANQNLEKLGLIKLPISNPYKAPPGAIVVVRAGTPGTAHPVAGDIAIAEGNGRFFNGGEMSYGGPHHFPPGNNYVLGIYVPK